MLFMLSLIRLDRHHLGVFCFSTLLLARLADHTILIEYYELRGLNIAVHEAPSSAPLLLTF
jgi:hypothetical protein